MYPEKIVYSAGRLLLSQLKMIFVPVTYYHAGPPIKNDIYEQE